MTASENSVRTAQLMYVSACVRQLDPSATDTAIARYLSEIKTMAEALATLDMPDHAEIEPFTAEWPGGDGT